MVGIWIGENEFESSGLLRVGFGAIDPPRRVFVGSEQVWPPPYYEEIATFGTPGTTTITVPPWAIFADIVVLGGGGGGSGGDWVSSIECKGGYESSWQSRTVSISGRSGRVVVGGGGARGSSGNGGSDGGETRVELLGLSNTFSSGGVGGTGYGNGEGKSPGNHTAFGQVFTGGQKVSRTQPGNPPGGGGGSASGGPLGRTLGGDGGGGFAWVRFRSS